MTVTVRAIFVVEDAPTPYAMLHNDGHDLRKVFIVDGDEPTRSAIALVVRSFGWSVRTFATAIDCLCALLLEQPDCIVTALKMPTISGADMVELMAARSISVPVIIIADQVPDEVLMESAHAGGAKLILQKPYWDEDLRGAIKRVIAEAQNARAIPG